MPIKVQSDLPAKEQLENENIFVMDEFRSLHQDIRPLKIVILNLMPLKEDTELQLLRCLSNTPLQIDVTFMMMKSHVAANTSANHLNQFYITFDDIKDHKYDGMIITGAPVEKMKYEDVDYWDELCQVFEWTKTHVTSTFHICWGAQAGLYYHYGLNKVPLKRKLSGVYTQRVLDRKVPLVRGCDDIFKCPHSRHTEVPAEVIHACKEIKVLAESDEAGVFLCMAQNGRQIFVMGHSEYDRMTLDQEYKRDLAKGLKDVDMPVNYYIDDDPEQRPLLTWRSASDLIYSNWLNYYVYQETPYALD